MRDNPDPAVSSYNANRDDVHEVFRRCRSLMDGYRPERVLLGETWVMELYETLPAPAGVWAFRRGEHTAVAVNLSDEPAEIDLDGRRELAPWGGIVADV